MTVTGNGSGQRRDPETLGDFHVSPPPSSRAVHLLAHEIKQKWQEAYRDEQRTPNYTQTQKENL